QMLKSPHHQDQMFLYRLSFQLFPVDLSRLHFFLPFCSSFSFFVSFGSSSPAISIFTSTCSTSGTATPSGNSRLTFCLLDFVIPDKSISSVRISLTSSRRSLVA